MDDTQPASREDQPGEKPESTHATSALEQYIQEPPPLAARLGVSQKQWNYRPGNS